MLTGPKGRTESNTVIVDFSAPPLGMDRSSRQKINKETLDLNYTLHQMGQTSPEHSLQQQQNTHSSEAHMSILQDKSWEATDIW